MFIEQPLLDPGELRNQLIEALADSFPLDLNYIHAIGEMTQGRTQAASTTDAYAQMFDNFQEGLILSGVENPVKKKRDEVILNEETTSEVTAKGRTSGVFRCLNCFVKISPPSGAKTCKCPQCSFEWRVSWPQPNLPRIRGPVWEVNRRLSEEAAAKEKERQK